MGFRVFYDVCPDNAPAISLASIQQLFDVRGQVGAEEVAHTKVEDSGRYTFYIFLVF
jgi:hypothetical protein